MEKVFVPSTKISKKIGVPSVEGRKKVHVPYNYTIYSHCVRGVICNDQQSLPLTAGGLGAL